MADAIPLNCLTDGTPLKHLGEHGKVDSMHPGGEHPTETEARYECPTCRMVYCIDRGRLAKIGRSD